MRVGIISDIHADSITLRRVLDFLRNRHQVDHILCAGDLVGRGTEPDQVVELIQQSRIPTVRGNHDEFAHELSAVSTHFLRRLPLHWEERLEGRKIFMCHGKPGNNCWGIYRKHVSQAFIELMLHSLKADVLITGHTHLPLYIPTDKGCLINPGSLYAFPHHSPSSRTYGVLKLPELLFELYDLISGTAVTLPDARHRNL